MIKRNLIYSIIFFLLAGCSWGPSFFHSRANSDELAAGINYFQQSNKTVFLHLIETRIGSPEIEDALWYLALISEKLDKPNIARQKIKLFIRSYPSSSHKKAAEGKIAFLDGLQAPHNLKEKAGGEKKESQLKRSPTRTGSDKISGSFVTEYLYDEQLSPSPSINTQSRLSEFLDFRWRKGSGPDLRFNFSGMNANDFLTSRNNRTRLSKFFLEGNNVDWFSNFRIGRQPSSGSTLFNRFDGLSFSLPVFLVTWTNNLGVPVNIFATDPLAIESNRKFYETYLSVVDFGHITGKVYFTQEYFQDFSTRKAMGLNGFWMYDTLNITTLLDRDIDFNKFNDGMVNFDYTHSVFRYSGLVEYRRNPFLDYGNALADPWVVTQTPPITSLDVLQQIKTREEIMQLALNNSQPTLDYSLGLSVELSSIWRVDFRYGETFYNPTDLSSHILTLPLTPAEKTTKRYSIFILERNFLNLNEIASTLFLYSPGTDSTNTSIVANLLKVWPNGFQGGLRFRYENTEFNLSGGNTLTRIVPGFMVRYPLKNGVEAGIEADYTMEQNNASPDMTSTIQTRASLSAPF
ncbi:MAG: hypothetical protein HY202_06750 [Nitrospirae bacterium]|nr:hypothetical protein [Nitrospirota bacterium]